MKNRKTTWKLLFVSIASVFFLIIGCSSGSRGSGLTQGTSVPSALSDEKPPYQSLEETTGESLTDPQPQPILPIDSRLGLDSSLIKYSLEAEGIMHVIGEEGAVFHLDIYADENGEQREEKRPVDAEEEVFIYICNLNLFEVELAEGELVYRNKVQVAAKGSFQGSIIAWEDHEIEMFAEDKEGKTSEKLSISLVIDGNLNGQRLSIDLDELRNQENNAWPWNVVWADFLDQLNDGMVDGDTEIDIELGFGENLGVTAKSVGDINGDGLPDIVLSKTSRSTALGNIQMFYPEIGLYYGKMNNGKLTYADQPDVTFDYFLWNIQAFSQYTIEGVGDINGDGCHDLVLGFPNKTYGFSFIMKGETYIIFGGSSNPDTSCTKKSDWKPVQILPFDADLIITAGSGGESRQRFGRVGGRMDIDGDGLNDLLVGSPGAHDGMGTAYLFLGSALKKYWEDKVLTLPVFLRSLTKYLDSQLHAAIVFSGFSSIPEGCDPATLENDLSACFPKDFNQAKAFGISVGSVGDVIRYTDDFDGNSVEDILIQAPGWQGKENLGVPGETAEAYVYSGEWLRAMLEDPERFASDSLTSLPRSSSSVPRTVYILTDSADWKIPLEISEDIFTLYPSNPIGNLIGDDTDDFIITTPTSRSTRGSTSLLQGEVLTNRSDENITKEPYLILQGENPGDYFGSSLLSVPDSDGDGQNELLAGAYRYEMGYAADDGLNNGGVFLFTSTDLNNKDTSQIALVEHGSMRGDFLGFQMDLIPYSDEHGEDASLILISSPGIALFRSGKVQFYTLEELLSK